MSFHCSASTRAFPRSSFLVDGTRYKSSNIAPVENQNRNKETKTPRVKTRGVFRLKQMTGANFYIPLFLAIIALMTLGGKMTLSIA